MQNEMVPNVTVPSAMCGCFVRVPWCHARVLCEGAMWECHVKVPWCYARVPNEDKGAECKGAMVPRMGASSNGRTEWATTLSEGVVPLEGAIQVPCARGCHVRVSCGQ